MRAKATKGLSDVHEDMVAAALKGRKTSGSGNKDHDKGDVKDVRIGPLELLVECKATSARSMRLKSGWLVKITDEAAPTRIPALSIRFTEDALQQEAQARFRRPIPTEEEWVMVPMSVFRRLVDAADSEE